MVEWLMIYTTKLKCWNDLDQARHLQFEHVPIIMDLRVQYADAY